MSNEIIAAAGSALGVILLEITRRLLSAGKDRSDIATALRTEMRLEITSLKKERDDLADEVERWRDRYYDLREQRIEDLELPHKHPNPPITKDRL